MNLNDIIRRTIPPVPWAEGEKIPWYDPEFSQRMLREHLSQAHDAASRRFEVIEQHVAWIHNHLLAQTPSKILDLGCGPGLYTRRLAKLGHTCTGIDYGPASIAYARQQTNVQSLACTYLQQDVRLADFGSGYNLAMMIFGEFNVFKAQDAEAILQKAHQALDNKGLLLLEAHTLAAVQKIGNQPAAWHTAESGLFSDFPYICLKEGYWQAETQVATERYYIIDGKSANVTRYVASIQGYNETQYLAMLQKCGFSPVEFYSEFGQHVEEDFVVIFAKKT